MSNLKEIEKRRLERAFGMSSGYVLNFSNNTFAQFVLDSVGLDIYDRKYDYGTGSKANRMRAFWDAESNYTVGKLLGDIFENWDELAHQTQPPEDCLRIVRRLKESKPVPDIEKIRKILRHRERHDLAELLQYSTSKLDESTTYGTYLFSWLTTFEIYSPIANHDKLKSLSKADQDAILNAVLEIYPPKCDAPEITDIVFYVDMNLESGPQIASSIRHKERVLELFYSYSHRDEELRNELDKHLSILKRRGMIDSWHYRRILAGKEWEGEIDKHLNIAQIILLLISADFLDSDYCYDVELERAIERHEAGEACVIPVILRAVYWKDAPFGKLKALPKDAKPVTSWDNQDEAFADIAEGIAKLIEDIKAKPL